MKYFVDIPKLKHSKILQEMQCVLLRDLLLKIQMGLMGKCNKMWWRREVEHYSVCHLWISECRGWTLMETAT